MYKREEYLPLYTKFINLLSLEFHGRNLLYILRTAVYGFVNLQNNVEQTTISK